MRITIKEIFQLLAGDWDLCRSTNGFGAMKGRAQFLSDLLHPFMLFYREEGIFTTNTDISLSFYKEYIYSFANERIEVYFAHKGEKIKFFHSLHFSFGTSYCTALARHRCEQDTYRAKYTFLDRDTFSLEYNINGPRKALTIYTLFKRH